MLKPIKPKKYIAGGAGLGFARKTLERKAAEGLYDFSETELVFALGASSERDGILSVLRQLDRLLDALKKGIGFRGGYGVSVYIQSILNAAQNILGRGGASKEYLCAVEVYNELCAVLKANGFSGGFSGEELDALREKIAETVNRLNSVSTLSFGRIVGEPAKTADIVAAKAFGAASKGVLRMTARNPELFKAVGSNRAFLELALKCEEKRRRSSGLRRRFSALVAELNERQTEFLRRFILENGMFSEVVQAEKDFYKEKDTKSVLEFIATRSSERELEKFFDAFERRLNSKYEKNNAGYTASENNAVFSSVGEMREFFISADVSQLESFAEYLRVNNAREADVVEKALGEYILLSRKSSELLQKAVEIISQNAELSHYSREKLFENAEFVELFNKFNSRSKENISEKIYAENSEFVLSYAEFAVNRARENKEFESEFRKSAEKIERVLYYEQSESSLKANEIRKIIGSAQGEALKQFAQLLSEFTKTDSFSTTSRALYEYIDRFALNERLSEAEKLLKHVVTYNSDAEALAVEIERFAESNSSFSFWSVLERLGEADKLTGLYSVNNRTFERFSEWIKNQLSDYDGKNMSKTLRLLKAYYDSRGLSESFERLISEIKSETMSAEEYEKAYSEFERAAEIILTLVENSESTLEEELSVISEKLERFSEKDFADRSEIIREVERVFSAFEEKKRLQSELSEQIKLQLSENSNTNVEDLNRTIKSIVSAFEEKEQSELSEQIKLKLSENSNTNVEDLKRTIKSIISAFEEKEQSELSEQIKLKLSENSNTNVEDLKRTINSIISAFEEKERSELSEQIKLKLSENSPAAIDDLKRTIENVVSVLEQRKNTVLSDKLHAALEKLVEYREGKLQQNEIGERKFESGELSQLLNQGENFSDLYEGDLEFISKTLEYLKLSENDFDKEEISEVSREINYVLDNINRLEHTLPKNLELVSSLTERFKLSETESEKIAVTEEIMRCLEEPMIRLYADSAVLSEFVRISREFQNGKVKTSEIEREYESLSESLVSSYRNNAVNFEKLKTEFKTLGNSYSEMTASERLREFGRFFEQLSLCNSQGMIGGERFSEVLKAVERIKQISAENLLKFADERTDGLATVYFQVSKLLKNVRKSVEENDREHFTEVLKNFDEMLSDEKISQTGVLSEIKRLTSNVEDIKYSEYEQSLFERSIETAAENIRLVYAQSLVKSKLNAEKETVNSLKNELYELKTEFSQTAGNSERIERFTENVLRMFNAVKNKSLTENETAEFKRLSEYLERSDNLNERSDLSRGKFTRELFEAITADVSQTELNLAIYANESRTQKLSELKNRKNIQIELNGFTPDEKNSLNLAQSRKIALELLDLMSVEAAEQSINSVFSDSKTVFSTTGTTVFGIKQINGAAKSVVGDKVIYNAVKKFYGEHTDEIADFIEQKAAAYEIINLRAWNNKEILPTNSLFWFSREAVLKQTEYAAQKLLIHTAKAANSPYERIYLQLEKQNERADYSGAELFYTEEYFDNSRGAVTVNYAVNANQSVKSEEVSERLSGLNGKIDNISREISEVRKSEQEMSKRFVLKSESSVLEQEIKSSIERDILLAGKRHGIF